MCKKCLLFRFLSKDFQFNNEQLHLDVLGVIIFWEVDGTLRNYSEKMTKSHNVICNILKYYQSYTRKP